MIPSFALRLFAATGCALALVACGLTPDGSTDPEPVGPEVHDIEEIGRPWTQEFMDAGLLVADVVYIEGPKGLLDHVALSQDDELMDYTVETTPDGFRQSLVKKQGVGYAELRGALDALSITALRSLVVLERPGDLPVRIVAKGSVWYRGMPTTSLERAGWAPGEVGEWRGDELELVTR